MNAVREAWTDERLDDLQVGMHREFAQVRADMNLRFDRVDKRLDKIDEKFDKVDEKFDKVDEKFAKIDERFDKVDARFVAMDARFGARFDGLERTLIAGFMAIIAAIIAAGIF
ncbi:MAG TPA: hypothetical protein VGI73_05810 [Solirubrobacterales bacterium]|jgi:predicted nuclease with TOPRIM domain